MAVKAVKINDCLFKCTFVLFPLKRWAVVVLDINRKKVSLSTPTWGFCLTADL